VYSALPCVQQDGWHVMRRAFCESGGAKHLLQYTEAEAAQAASKAKTSFHHDGLRTSRDKQHLHVTLHHIN